MATLCAADVQTLRSRSPITPPSRPLLFEPKAKRSAPSRQRCAEPRDAALAWLSPHRQCARLRGWLDARHLPVVFGEVADNVIGERLDLRRIGAIQSINRPFHARFDAAPVSFIVAIKHYSFASRNTTPAITHVVPQTRDVVLR